MTPERWRKVKEIFQSCFDLDPAARKEYLDKACAGDEPLREEVEKLLQAHSEAGDFIEKPAVPPAFAVQSLPEKHFGPYRVLREIGHGGMGAVYLGIRADDEYKKRVAIKVVQCGDREEILRRFRHERQILATLDHPNIARLLDGGTTPDGEPYFVMDFVEGLPLGEYCDTHRLSINERLRLFRMVCSAVQYVHQNLVVHRDLKPGNILVAADGTPKLLDFGIAKLLKPELLTSPLDVTRVEMRLMTPGYASPEQVRGEPVTTAGDVYSLGVILYELLTGHRPYKWKTEAPGEIARVVCEEEPQKPSTVVTRAEEAAGGRAPVTAEHVSRLRETTPERLQRTLSGDLDAIVLKAMRKEPRRRYASAEQLSEDIGRYLSGMPVLAHSDTVTYRASKFIRRNRVGVAAAALVALSLLAGIFTTAWQARVAETQRARAERRFNDVRKLANSFLFEIHDAIQNLPGSTPARQLVVRKALEYLDSLARESAGDPDLAVELAEAYRKVGDVQGNPLNANLGDTAGAQESFRKALHILDAVVARNPDHPGAQRSLATIYQKIADTQIFTGNVKMAAENIQKSLALNERLAKEGSEPAARRTLAISYLKAGDVLGNPGHPNLGNRAGALKHYETADSILASLYAASPSDAQVRRLRSVIRERVGYCLESEGRLAEAEENYARALAITQSLAAESPDNAGTRRDLASGYARMAKVSALKGDFARAKENYRRSLDLLEALAAADPSNMQARRSLADVYVMSGDALRRARDLTGAEQAYRKGLTLFTQASSADPKNTALRESITGIQERLGSLRKR